MAFFKPALTLEKLTFSPFFKRCPRQQSKKRVCFRNWIQVPSLLKYKAFFQASLLNGHQNYRGVYSWPGTLRDLQALWHTSPGADDAASRRGLNSPAMPIDIPGATRL